MHLAKRFIVALTLLVAAGLGSAQATPDNPSTHAVFTLAEMLTGHEVGGATAEERANSAQLFLWEMQRPGVLSLCVFLRMEDAVSSATLDQDTAVLFLADLVDGTDSVAQCDAAAVRNAEGQLEALGLTLPGGELRAQSVSGVDMLLSEAKDHSGRLRRAFERNH